MIKIFKKKVEGHSSVLIRTFATIEGYTKEEIFDAICDVNIRKEWDKIFSEFKIVDKTTDNEVLYMSIKVNKFLK